MENIIDGGFTCFRAFDSSERELFDKTLQHLIGVWHEPLAVATAVVKGINYAFLCISAPVIPGAVEKYNSLVIIHQPLPDENGIPHILEIRKIKII